MRFIDKIILKLKYFLIISMLIFCQGCLFVFYTNPIYFGSYKVTYSWDTTDKNLCRIYKNNICDTSIFKGLLMFPNYLNIGIPEPFNLSSLMISYNSFNIDFYTNPNHNFFLNNYIQRIILVSNDQVIITQKYDSTDYVYNIFGKLSNKDFRNNKIRTFSQTCHILNFIEYKKMLSLKDKKNKLQLIIQNKQNFLIDTLEIFIVPYYRERMPM